MPAALANRDEIIEQVFSLVESGTSLRESCRNVGVAASTVLGWCDSDDAASERYARARAGLVDSRLNEMADIVDNATPETAQAAKLQWEHRRWELSRIMQRKFGDRQVIDMSVSQTISIRDALAQAERRVIDVVARPVLSAPEGLDDTER